MPIQNFKNFQNSKNLKMGIGNRSPKNGTPYLRGIGILALLNLSITLLLTRIYFRYDPETITSDDFPTTGSDANVDIQDVQPRVRVGSRMKDDTSTSSFTWCNKVTDARSKLNKTLSVSYPCEHLKPATSAVVCMLTDGATNDKASATMSSKQNYINGAMALGQSVARHIDPSKTHMLLMIRDGFPLGPDDRLRLQAVGWTIGTAPNFPLKQEYLPRFPRYKTTYTKVTAIGLEEYECVMMMDADTLVIGDISELLTCKIFTSSKHRVAGTIDYYQHRWILFNTGSLLYRTSVQEMERVFRLTQDETFMRRYSSDQEFLNHVYPERKNKSICKRIAMGDLKGVNNGSVVNLGWDYNAQTHVEGQIPRYWQEQRSSVKILHFTEKKGWQCEERHTEPLPWDQPYPCPKKDPLCYCREAHLYWDAFRRAEELASKALELP